MGTAYAFNYWRSAFCEPGFNPKNTNKNNKKKKPALQKLTNIKRSKLHTSNNAKQIGK